jgi:cell division control protein 7
MAKARTSLQRHVEQIDVHEDDTKEQDIEETLDESIDALEESEHSSDEEVEQSVAEDMSRFEETFVGINKRFRLINRIGEGMLWRQLAQGYGLS